ncbi:MAG: flagellar biosynthesis protein FlgD [Clostridium argentinense]|uniref:Basal-body rod modification protein FlgD n=1 Tax=Clostridium faecium TaxID=2762223 RepID=A0ABR8YR18_9CLOT|nr:flagellar biosynthesis protein FlgD [Clostridium faecium]MBS5825149.1 flagellar biosynthesis protein FlgD [Clostridium argentinense]
MNESDFQHSGVTERGTKVVKAGADLNKNAFLQILAAELANQDPTNPQDSTAYVAQMAQFAGLEQMNNLNTTMRLSSATSLTGKFVALDAYNTKGQQEFGIVNAVYKIGSNVFVTVATADGEIKNFDYDSVCEVINNPDNTLDYINFVNGSNLIGKTVEMYAKEEEEPDVGIVKEIFRDEEGIKVKIEVEIECDGEIKTEIKDYPFDHIMKIRS